MSNGLCNLLEAAEFLESSVSASKVSNANKAKGVNGKDHETSKVVESSLETSEKHKSDFVELKTASCSLVSNSFIQALNSTVTPDISEVMKIVNEKPKVLEDTDPTGNDENTGEVESEVTKVAQQQIPSHQQIYYQQGGMVYQQPPPAYPTQQPSNNTAFNVPPSATLGHMEAGVTSASPYLYTVAPHTGQWTDQQPLMYVTEYGGAHQQAALAPPDTKVKATAKEGTKQRKQAASSSDKIKPVTKKEAKGNLSHNELEKNRRAHLKQCFNELRQVIPTLKGTTRRDSNFSILTSAFKHIQWIQRRSEEFQREIARQNKRKAARLLHFDFLYNELKEQHGVEAVDKYLEENRTEIQADKGVKNDNLKRKSTSEMYYPPAIKKPAKHQTKKLKEHSKTAKSVQEHPGQHPTIRLKKTMDKEQGWNQINQHGMTNGNKNQQNFHAKPDKKATFLHNVGTSSVIGQPQVVYMLAPQYNQQVAALQHQVIPQTPNIAASRQPLPAEALQSNNKLAPNVATYQSAVKANHNRSMTPDPVSNGNIWFSKSFGSGSPPLHSEFKAHDKKKRKKTSSEDKNSSEDPKLTKLQESNGQTAESKFPGYDVQVRYDEKYKSQATCSAPKNSIASSGSISSAKSTSSSSSYTSLYVAASADNLGDLDDDAGKAQERRMNNHWRKRIIEASWQEKKEEDDHINTNNNNKKKIEENKVSPAKKTDIDVVQKKNSVKIGKVCSNSTQSSTNTDVTSVQITTNASTSVASGNGEKPSSLVIKNDSNQQSNTNTNASKQGTVVTSQQFSKQPQVSHNSQQFQTNQVIMTTIQGNPAIQQPIIVQNSKQGQGQIAYQVIQPQVIHGANNQHVIYAAPQLTQQGANGKGDASQQQMQLISQQQRPTLVQLANGQTGVLTTPIQPQQSAYMLPLSYMMVPQQSSNNGNNKQQQLVAAPIIMQAPQKPIATKTNAEVQNGKPTNSNDKQPQQIVSHQQILLPQNVQMQQITNGTPQYVMTLPNNPNNNASNGGYVMGYLPTAVQGTPVGQNVVGIAVSSPQIPVAQQQFVQRQ